MSKELNQEVKSSVVRLVSNLGLQSKYKRLAFGGARLLEGESGYKLIPLVNVAMQIKSKLKLDVYTETALIADIQGLLTEGVFTLYNERGKPERNCKMFKAGYSVGIAGAKQSGAVADIGGLL
jgi:hypothetical protein